MKKRIISTAIAAILAVSALSTSAFAVTNFDSTSGDEFIFGTTKYSTADTNNTTNFEWSDTFTQNADNTFTKTLSNGYVIVDTVPAAKCDSEPNAKTEAVNLIKAAIAKYEGVEFTDITKVSASATKIGTPSATTIQFTGKLVSPKIRVMAPTGTATDGNAKYVLNPYGLTVQFNDNTEFEDGYTDAQIISQKLKFENGSDCAIGVGVKLYSSANGNAKVAKAPIEETDTYKSIFIYAVGGEAVADADDVTVAKTAYSEDAANVLAQSTAAQKNFKTLLTLEAFSDDTDNNVWGAIDLQGQLNTNLKAGTEWEEADTLTVNLVYQFSQVKL